MIEFGDMTVRFQKISRGFTHEMVRHRLCSFAQESTRYVDESELSCVIPPHKSKNEILIQLIFSYCVIKSCLVMRALFIFFLKKIE